MPMVRVDLPQHAYERLCQEAVKQRRPIPWEAEVRLLRSLRVPLYPAEPTTPPTRRLRPADPPEAA